PTTGSLSNDDGVFAINASTGVITVVGALDFETTPTYTRVVAVTDSGSPRLGDAATITININDVNEAPTISDIADQTIDEDTSTGPLAFVIGDQDTDVNDLTVSATSSNQALVPDANLLIAGMGANRTIVATPLADAFGVTTITVTVNDGSSSSSDSFVLTVTPVNDPPRFEIFPADIAALPEDAVIAGAEAYALRAVDPEGGVLSFSITSGNQYLLPNANLGIGGSGNDRTISFTLATDKNSVTAAQDFQNGSITVTVIAFDPQGLSAAEDFIIQSVTAVNDAPTFTAGGAQNVLEDAGLQTVNWASNFRPGPNTATDESTQTVAAYTVTPLPGATVNFVSGPSISNAGVLTYQTAENDFGNAAFEVRVVDTGSGVAPNTNQSAPQTLFVNVQAVNDPPVAFDDAATVLEDATATLIDVLANDTDVENDLLSVVAVTQPANGTVSFTASGVSYTPDGDFFGSDSFTYTVSDGDLSDVGTVTITVTSVNDAPSFTLAGDQTVLEDSGAATVNAFLTDALAGPPNESMQVLGIAVSNDNTALFAVQPSIDLGTGTLSFSPAADAFGSALVTVTVSDDGGTANGGVDSSTQTFTITVTGVNDAPSFTAADPATVLEDAGAQTVSGWASFNAGP
ncbi:VCBS repeat-containing protein, partial [Aquimonas voraii]